MVDIGIVLIKIPSLTCKYAINGVDQQDHEEKKKRVTTPPSCVKICSVQEEEGSKSLG
jgi:hypothetical protein